MFLPTVSLFASKLVAELFDVSLSTLLGAFGNIVSFKEASKVIGEIQCHKYTLNV